MIRSFLLRRALARIARDPAEVERLARAAFESTIPIDAAHGRLTTTWERLHPANQLAYRNIARAVLREAR